MVVRTLATGLAVNRLLWGVSALAAPSKAAGTWIGSSAADPGTGVIVRSQGARDIAIGLGALAALRDGSTGPPRAWFAAQALTDAADLAATLAAWRSLPTPSALFGASVAAGSAAIALAATRL